MARTQPDALQLQQQAGLPALSVNSLNSQESAEGEAEDELHELPSSNASSPSKPLSEMSAAERRDHSRRHSRIHSRNLSVFFPQPGTQAEYEADFIQANRHLNVQTKSAVVAQKASSNSSTQLLVPSSSSTSSLGGAVDRVSQDADSPNGPSRSRKGHHRQRSVLHHDFGSDAFEYNGKRNSDSEPANVKMFASHHQQSSASSSLAFRFLSTPAWQLLSEASLPPAYQSLLLFGTCHFLLGSFLWFRGQIGDSLALSGLGYLVIFDAIGILNSVAVAWRTEQRDCNGKPFVPPPSPYALHRFESVLQFSQTVFLLFAAVYITKESVEHALLEGTELDHEQDDIGLHLPAVLLALTAFACFFSNVVLQNHVKLVAACGLSTSASEASSLRRRGHDRSGSILVDSSTITEPLLKLLANPFSITILFFCAILSVSSVFMPPLQVAALDKVLAGLESAAMLYTAYPASKALGKILLQTAPAQHDVQHVQLRRTLSNIESHQLITFVAPPKVWQLTPPTSALNSSTSSAALGSSLLLGQAIRRTAKNAALVASIQIHTHHDTSDLDVLAITKWAWQQLAPAVGAGAGVAPGNSLRGALMAGELTVEVKRDRHSSSTVEHRTREADCLHAVGTKHKDDGF